MSLPNHATTILSVWDMVKNRLSYISDDTEQTLGNELTWEAMHNMEVCFRIDKDLEDGGTSSIGNEAAYSVPQRSLLADLVAIGMLTRKLLSNASTSSGSDGSTSTFIKKAGAGSAEVEFEQVDGRKLAGGSVFSLTPVQLLKSLRQSAIAKGVKLGCELIFLDDGGLEVSCFSCNDLPTPFIVKTCK